MHSLWFHETEIAQRILAQKRILLLLDFDGTLAPLAQHPDRVRLGLPINSSLLQIKSNPRARIAVISGRSLKNLKSHFRMKSFFYVGNHGLEISGPKLSFHHTEATRLQPVIRSLVHILRREFGKDRGVVVEDKGLTLSLHYREVPLRSRSLFLRRLLQIRKKTIHLPVQWSTGHKVWEVRPRVHWNKGQAARYLMQNLKHPFPVAMGDDRTDEDMFRIVNGRGISIRVGHPRLSVAKYRIGSQKEVLKFLNWMNQLLLTK